MKPTEMDILEEADSWELNSLIRLMTCEYEVRKTDEVGRVNVTEFHREPGSYECMDEKYLENFDVEGEIIKLAGDDYFEKYDFRKIISGDQEEVDAFCCEAAKLPFQEQRKLYAVLEVEFTKPGVKCAFDVMGALDDYEIYPDILTYRDYGYMMVYECSEYDLPSELARYFDFDLLATHYLFRREGIIGISSMGFVQSAWLKKSYGSVLKMEYF